MILLASSLATAQFAGGSGTEEDPYQIETIEQLQAINDSLYLDKHFIQISDVDASVTEGWNDGKGFEPIGWNEDIDSQTGFSGIYNGQNYRIHDLYINNPDSIMVGLFGFISSAVLKNIYLEDVTIIGYNTVGGISGMAWYSELTNVIADGEIIGESSVGGLIGSSDQTNILKSKSTANITGIEHIGGLIGFMESGIISKSSSSGQIIGDHKLGGLAGTWLSIDPEYSHITNSFSDMDISGTSEAGGLIGYMSSTIETGFGLLDMTYATGMIEADEIKGAIAGNISRCLLVSATYWDEKMNLSEDIGSQYSGSCFDYFGVENVEEVQHIKKLTTEQMTGQNAYIHMYHLDFEKIWQVTEGYPVLQWQNPQNAVEPPNVAILLSKSRTLDFGDVQINESDTLEVTLINNGRASMSVEFALSGEHPENYSFSNEIGLVTMAIGDTLMIEIIFSPESVEQLPAVLQITHDAPNVESPLEIQLDGKGKIESSTENHVQIPKTMQLYQNYPNPYNPTTQIRYSLPDRTPVTLTVYDIMGRHVATLVDNVQEPGNYQVTFDGSGMASGMYVYRLQTPDQTITRQMLLVK